MIHKYVSIFIPTKENMLCHEHDAVDVWPNKHCIGTMYVTYSACQ